MNPLDEITSPEILAYRLTATHSAELEKVKAIFNWITENIDYAVRSYNSNRYALIYDDEDDDTSSIFETLDQRVAKLVLKRKTAVCDGYARLFKTVCGYAGIKSEVITGYARTGTARQFRCNHKWNAVLIDCKWYLLDVTWASGYLNFSGNEFIRDYNGSYFLTPPQHFIYDHYPEDLQWTLLDNPPTLREYNHAPFKNTAYQKFNIVSYKPAKGIIETSVGDSIQIELETNDTRKNLRVSDTLSIDSAVLSGTGCEDVKPVCTINGKKVSSTYKVSSSTVQWLQVIFNNEVIMRYKLNIKRSDAAEVNADKNLA
ncbi:MAG: transglutaminase domain-containing protein, partial [Parafilimonas sp.]